MNMKRGPEWKFTMNRRMPRHRRVYSGRPLFVRNILNTGRRWVIDGGIKKQNQHILLTNLINMGKSASRFGRRKARNRYIRFCVPRKGKLQARRASPQSYSKKFLYKFDDIHKLKYQSDSELILYWLDYEAINELCDVFGVVAFDDSVELAILEAMKKHGVTIRDYVEIRKI